MIELYHFKGNGIVRIQKQIWIEHIFSLQYPMPLKQMDAKQRYEAATSLLASSPLVWSTAMATVSPEIQRTKQGIGSRNRTTSVK